MKYEFGWKILIELTAIRQKRNRYLTDGTIKIKNQQVLKSASLNEKLILKIINIVQKQLSLKSNCIEKNKLNMDSLRKSHEELRKETNQI